LEGKPKAQPSKFLTKPVLKPRGQKPGFCLNIYQKTDDFWKKPGFLCNS